MRLWRIAAVFAAAAGAWGQPAGSAAGIVSTVRQAVDTGESDARLAKALRKVKLTERLDESVVEELESEGAGPKAVAELEKLSAASQRLAEANPAPVFQHPPPPSTAERGRILAQARAISLNYSRSLPDFICMETVRRFEGSRGYWDLKDTLEVRLSYFDQKEQYDLLSRNGKPTTLPYRDVGGAVSEGDFGSTLLSVFAPDTHTEFRWDHWTTLRKRPAHVFTFRIALEDSTYRMEFRSSLEGPVQRAIAGQHGLVYVDAESFQVVRIVSDTDDIPRDFPVRDSLTRLDYGFVKVGDGEYLLPSRVEVEMATDFIRTRNLVEFHGYRKFAGESTITFH